MDIIQFKNRIIEDSEKEGNEFDYIPFSSNPFENDNHLEKYLFKMRDGILEVGGYHKWMEMRGMV